MRYGVPRRRSPSGSRGEPELRAQPVECRRRELDRQLFDGCEPEPYTDERDAERLGDERRGELPALADDHVGLVLVDDRAQPGERGAGVDPREELTDHRSVGALDAVLRELGHERHPLLGRWVADGCERKSRALDVRLVLALRRHQHVVAGGEPRVTEWGERKEVSRRCPAW